MQTYEKPLKTVFGRSIWQLATLRQMYLEMGYKVTLDSTKGIVEVYNKDSRDIDKEEFIK